MEKWSKGGDLWDRHADWGWPAPLHPQPLATVAGVVHELTAFWEAFPTADCKSVGAINM